jgi:hypothetical protein
MITADRTDFTADGACLRSGGQQQTVAGSGGITVRQSAVLSPFGAPRLENLANVN